MGLAPQSPIELLPSFWEQIANDPEIESVCSFYLNNDNNRKAEFTLGGYNIEKYA